MIDQEGELAEVLVGGLLAERPVQRGAFGTDATVFMVPIGRGEGPSAWRAARALVDRTGRWPVVAWADAGGLASPLEICARAEQIAAEEVIAERLRVADSQVGMLRRELDMTDHSCGAAPGADEVEEALGANPGSRALDRWLLHWEEDCGLTPEVSDSYLDRVLPEFQTHVAFLPTTRSWEAPAYLRFFEADEGGPAERLVAVLRSWHERFGADVMYHAGTTLNLVVERPPTTLDDAWDLAWEQNVLFSSTLGPPVRHHAGVLIGRHSWFLHHRP